MRSDLTLNHKQFPKWADMRPGLTSNHKKFPTSISTCGLTWHRTTNRKHCRLNLKSNSTGIPCVCERSSHSVFRGAILYGLYHTTGRSKDPGRADEVKNNSRCWYFVALLHCVCQVTFLLFANQSNCKHCILIAHPMLCERGFPDQPGCLATSVSSCTTYLVCARQYLKIANTTGSKLHDVPVFKYSSSSKLEGATK